MTIDIFVQIQKRFFGYTEPQLLYEAILEFLPQLGGDFASILLKIEGEDIVYRSTVPGREELVGPMGRRFAKKLITQSLEGQVMRRNCPEIVNDISTDSRWYRAAYLIEACRSAVLLPLNLPKAQTWGVLTLGSVQIDRFANIDLPILEAIVLQIGYAIENTLLYRKQRERATQLNLINEVSRAATSILNVNLMLTTVTQAVQQSFGFRQVGVYRLALNRNKILADTFTGPSGRSLHAEIALAEADPLIVQVIKEGQRSLINDVEGAKLQPPNIQSFGYAQNKSSEIKSRLVIPLNLGVKIIGALDLKSGQLDTFSTPLRLAMETLSDQLAVAIENAHLYDELRYSVNELTALNRISQAVSSSLDFQKTLTLITEHVTRMLNVAATSVALRDDEACKVWFAAASGEGAVDVLGQQLGLGQGVVGWVAQQGKALIVPDVRRDPRFFSEMDEQSGFQTKSILCVPLKTKGRLIGAIEAINKLDGHFSEQDLERLTALTAPAATAIENAQLYRDLARHTAQVDTLRAFNQNIIENITTGLIALDQAGVITVFNKAAAALLGLRAEETIGRNITKALSSLPELIPPLTTALNIQQRFDERDLIIKHWDGTAITVALTTTPMYNNEGELNGVVGLIEDMTKLKTLEAERRRLDRLAALGEMSAVVAHELRNPIAGIAAGVNYLTKKILEDAPDRQAAQMILGEVDRVHRIIEDILLVARPLKLQKEFHSLADIINDLGYKYQKILKEKDIELAMTLDKKLPEIMVDRARIEQVFSNLMENAFHAMPEGGAIRISLYCPSAGGEVIVVFKDNGHGILAIDQQKIFEPFTTTKSRGTGLGLALSRRILEAHNGSITLAPSDLPGATFEMRLPISNSQPTEYHYESKNTDSR